MTNRRKREDEDLEATETPRRRAGLLPDELEPGTVDPDAPVEERHAAGTPGGGDAIGGLGGTNQGDGSPDGLDIDRDYERDGIEIREKF